MLMKTNFLKKVQNAVKLVVIGGVFLISSRPSIGKTALSFYDHLLMDSIGVENHQGKQVVIHKLMPKETYYGISKRYNVSLDELITFNNNKSLKIGDHIRIPTSRVFETKSAVEKKPTNTSSAVVDEVAGPMVHLNPNEFTEYIVGKGETLYSVSKRFQVPVESIKLANGLSSDQLKLNMVLKVPHKAIALQVQEIAESSAGETGTVRNMDQVMDAGTVAQQTQAENDFEVKKNRYGMREVLEKGVGIWMEDLSTDGSNMLVLHKTAAIGTIVKITNPMTGHSTFAKVVGKFVDSAETQGAIIVISKSVASVIGLLDKRFQIEIAYGAVPES